MQNKQKIFSIGLTVLLAFLGCTPPDAPKEAPATPPAAPKAAEKAPPIEAPAPSKEPIKAAAAPEGAIALSGDITFVGRKVVGSHDFMFKTWSGHAKLAGEKIEGGSISFEIQTASVVADYKAPTKWTPKLEKHIKEPDFFDVAKFPTATFVSSKITADPKGAANTYQISGKLTIKNISKEVGFPAVIKNENGKVEATANITINRQDFGIVYPGKPDNLIQDDVVISIGARD